MEETGLSAEFRVAGVYHEIVYQKESGEQLEDKIFFVVSCTSVTGDLVQEFEGGRNEWMSRAEALRKPKIFSSFDTEIDIVSSEQTFIESRVEYTKELF